MIAAEGMTGRKGLSVTSLPHEALRDVLEKYNRLSK